MATEIKVGDIIYYSGPISSSVGYHEVLESYESCFIVKCLSIKKDKYGNSTLRTTLYKTDCRLASLNETLIYANET